MYELLSDNIYVQRGGKKKNCVVQWRATARRRWFGAAGGKVTRLRFFIFGAGSLARSVQYSALSARPVMADLGMSQVY